jgi:acetyl esterase/lipase
MSKQRSAALIWWWGSRLQQAVLLHMHGGGFMMPDVVPVLWLVRDVATRLKWSHPTDDVSGCRHICE